MQYLIKIILSGLIIAGVSELGKRFSPIAALLASLPLVSILAMIWLFVETKDNQKIIDLSIGIFWASLPSLIFFLALPLLLRSGVKFSLAMVISCAIMFVAYSVYIVLLGKLGMRL